MILHRPHRLPGQIAAMMAGTIVVFALTLGISVVWMSRALDRQARIDSARLVASAVSALESEMLAVNLEFAKWDHLVWALEEPDADWLYRNVGMAAATGLTRDLVVMWGATLERDLGWLDRSPPAAMSRLLDPRVLAQVESRSSMTGRAPSLHPRRPAPKAALVPEQEAPGPPWTLDGDCPLHGYGASAEDRTLPD